MSEPGDGKASPEPWALRNGRWIVVFGGAATLVVGLIAIFVLPTWNWAVGNFADGDLQSARADLRSSGLTVAAGIGVTTAGLLAWGRIELSRREHQLAERSQRNDTFTAAVQLLGHSDASVRLGGLYALEGLARDGYDRQTVYDIICAYARNYLPVDQKLFNHPPDELDPDMEDPRNYVVIPAIENRTADYEAAITIAARAPHSWKIRLDLSGTHVVGRDFISLAHCDFTKATLADCDFTEATLTECDFTEATLTKCNSTAATLADCDFTKATLTDCVFKRASISNGAFVGAKVDLCNFMESTLVNSIFAATTVTVCNFTKARIADGSSIEGEFVRCLFYGAIFDGFQFTKTTLTDCDFTGSTLSDGTLDGSTYDRTSRQTLLPDSPTTAPEQSS